MATVVNIVVGSLAWVEDDMAWIDEKVVHVSGEEIKIICTNEKLECDSQGRCCQIDCNEVDMNEATFIGEVIFILLRGSHFKQLLLEK
ncbi:hypothetical protein MRB53_002828 [Persea americana]|uniref:Uncharacterized protein n=1 Tax=Persea americana TaxID=3435 RepID=A0ACC2MWI9_PERAE|nr:hypothetical protein MRB53_002828 [Persea americana]